MREDQIKYMAERFLGWRLPENFDPDAGISYKRPNYAPEVNAKPCGTNLLNAAQAEAMVRYLTEGMPVEAPSLGDEQWETLQELLNAMGDLHGVFERVEAFMRGRGIKDPATEIKTLRAIAFA